MNKIPGLTGMGEAKDRISVRRYFLPRPYKMNGDLTYLCGLRTRVDDFKEDAIR
jgi:hypothetical protein